MALSGSQVTQHGISGYTQIPYSSFSGKSLQALFGDITGTITFVGLTPSNNCTTRTPLRTFATGTPNRTFTT